MTIDALYNRPGPNRLTHADVYRTTDVTKPVKIRMSKDGLGAEEPISIPGILKRTVNNYPDYPALKSKNAKKEYDTVTYRLVQKIFNFTLVF